MSDQFDNFFDLQRFEGTSSVNFGLIGESTAAKSDSGFYWGASGALLGLDNTTNYSTSAILQVNYSTSTAGTSTYYSITEIAEWVSLASASAADFKFMSISSTEVFNIIGLGDNTVEGLKFIGNNNTVPALNFSSAGESSNFLEISGGALSNIALVSDGAALTVNDNSSSITWSINSASLALDRNFTFAIDGTDSTLEILAGGTSVNFQYANAVNKIFGLSSNTVSGLSIAGGVSNLTLNFSNAGASDYLSIKGGELADVVLGTSGAALTVNEKTLTYDKDTDEWTNSGLTVNREALAINQNVTYVIDETDGTRTLKILNGSGSIISTGMGGASRFMPGAGVSWLYLGTGADPNEFNDPDYYYNFSLSSNAYFDLNDTGMEFNGFHFFDKGDTLYLNDKAFNVLSSGNFKLYYKEYEFQVTVNLSEGTFYPDFSKTLVLGDNGEFTLNNLLSGDGVLYDGTNVEVNFNTSDFISGDGDTVGGAIAFGASTGEILGVTVDSGGIVSVVDSDVDNTNTPDYKLAGSSITINGAAINIDNTQGFTYNNVSASNPYIDFTEYIGGGESSEFTDNKLIVNKWGYAKELRLGSTSSTNIQIGGGSDSVSFILTTAYDDNNTLKPGGGAFTFSGGDSSSLTGFIFGSESGTDSIIFDKSLLNAAGFSFGYTTDGYSTTSYNYISVPNVTLAGAGSGAVAQTSASAVFNLFVGGGSATVADYDNGTQVMFDGGASGFFQVAFDTTGDLEGFVPFTELLGGTSTMLADGMAFSVSGDMASNGSSGLYFGSASNNVAIASGSYVYTYNTGGGNVELVNGVDTVYALADATVLNLGGASNGAITDALNGSDASDPTYSYRSGGSAYFTVGATALSAFVFGTVDDAIGMSSGNTLGLEYLNNGTASALVNVPVVTGAASYWVEMTGASGSEFEVNTFGGAASVAVGSASFTFSGAGDSAALMFNAGGSALGFDAATGSVAMNTDAAAYLADGVFSINGTSVDIDARNITDGTLTYIAGESALLGLGDKSTITNASDITKIYAAAQSAATFTFGETDFTATVQGSYSSGDLAHYDVNGASATGFHFMLANDALNLPGSVSGFNLYDGASGNGFSTPTVASADGNEISSYTVVKQAGDSLFAVTSLSQGDNAQFTEGFVKFETLSQATGEILFNVLNAPTIALTGISGLLADNDAVRVLGATGGISIMGKTVEIIGENSGFLYTNHTSSDDTITEVYGDATIKAVADAKVIGAAAGQSGLGQFTFNIASPSQIFTVAGDTSNDGVSFQLGTDSKVVGVSGVNGIESVTGAFFVNGSFSLNNAEVNIANGTSNATNYTFYGASFAGLIDGDNLTAAGGISDFITAAAGSFTLLGTAMQIVGDSSVVFGVNGGLSTITDLGGANAYAYGSFSNAITVNGKSVNVTGDDTIAVYGNSTANGVTKIGRLSGNVDVVSADGVTMVGADGDGQFTFSFMDRGESFGLSGNGSEQTWFSFGAASFVTGISGLDNGETVTGSFSNAAIAINNAATLKIEGDTDGNSVTYAGSSYIVYDLDGGAQVNSASGIYSAWTDTIGTSGANFWFGSVSFGVAGDSSNGVQFVLGGDSVVDSVNDLDFDATLRGGLSSLNSVNGVTFGVGGDSNFGVIGGAGASGIRAIIDLSNGATVANAGGATLAVTDEQGTFWFGGVSFNVSGDSSVNFILNSAGSVVAVDELDANATLRGDLTGLSSINGTTFAVGGDTSLAVVGAASGISRILDLSNGATVDNAGGATWAVTDEVGAFTFDGKTFTIAGDSSVTFGLSGAAVTSVTDFNAPATITGQISGLKINGDATEIQISGDTDSIFSYAIDSASGATLGAVGGSNVTINYAASASVVQVINGGNYQFGTASAFTLAGTSAAIDFMVNGLSVTAVGGLNDTETLTGYGFGDITAINGAIFDIKGDAGDMAVVGNSAANGLTQIGNIGATGGVTINNVGGAGKVSTDLAGVFDFADNAAPFTVSGDTNVDFITATGQSASVIGVENFDGPATIAGALDGIYINSTSATIDITGDSDSLLSYMLNGTATLGSVGGDNVTINGVAGASVVQITASGIYNFSLGANEIFTLEGADNSVFFGLEGTTVKSIADFDNGDSVTGSFVNGITVSGGTETAYIKVTGDNSIMVEHDDITINKLSNGATIDAASGVSIAWTDALTGAALAIQDADGHRFTVNGTDSDGVEYLLDGNGHVIGVSSLDTGVTLTGGLSVLETINGAAFDVKGDSSVAVVGAATGISRILDLSNGATVDNAGGATWAVTDEVGAFTFDGKTFTVAGDSSVTFGLSGAAVTSVTNFGLGNSATITGQISGLKINGDATEIQISGDTDSIFSYAIDSASGATLGAVGGSNVTINYAAGASVIQVVSAGNYQFGSASAITLAGTSAAVDFMVNGLSVTAVGGLNDTETLTGYGFGDITAINGATFDIKGDAGDMAVVGNTAANGLTQIGNVGSADGVTINNVGNASKVSTDLAGVFDFANPAAPFTVSGDTNVDFVMATGQSASVIGVENFDEPATIAGALDGIYINETSATIDITGDSDSLFSYAVNGSTTLGSVGGSNVTINGVAGASVVQVVETGNYNFFGDKTFEFAGAGDSSVTFGLNGENVTAIGGLDSGETVTGDFNDAIAIDGSNVQVAGDSSVDVTNDGSKLELHALTKGANVMQADGVSSAFTDSSLTDDSFTFVNSTFTVSNDSDGVEFLLDGAANVIGIDGLNSGATLRGDINGLTVNGQTVDIRGDADGFGVVGGTSGISRIIDMSEPATVHNAGGASELLTDSDGVFWFEAGGVSYRIEGDSSVTFISDDGVSVASGVENLSGWIEADAAVFANGFSVNGQTVQIVGDEGTLRIHGTGTAIDTITGVGSSGGVTIQSTGDASVIITDKQGTIKFPNQTFTTGDDDTVTFGLDGATVSAIDGLNGWVAGADFDGVSVNGKSFDIDGDAGDMTIHGDDSGITEIAGVGSSGGVTINNVGGAGKVGTDAEGVFDFVNNAAPFTVSGDTNVDFITATGQSASVIGVENFDEPATIAGALDGVYINETSATIDISGDSDSIFSYAVNGSTTLGSVGGSNVTINGVAGASVVQVVEDGTYDFFGGQSFTLGTSDDSDGVNFVLEGTTVTAIESFDKGDSVTGDFTSAITVSGGDDSAVIQVANDHSIMVEHDDILIRYVSNDATIAIADNVYDAWTDSFDNETLSITDAYGHNFTLTGTDSDGVNFKLNGQGHILGIEDLDENVTLEGSVNELGTINGAELDIQGDSSFGVVGSNSGISEIFNLSGSATVNNAGGASKASTDTDGVFTFGGQSFTVAGDSAITFGLSNSTVVAIDGLSGTVTSNDFNDVTSVNGQSFGVEGDDDDLTVVGTADESGIEEIANVGASNAGTVKITASGGARKITTDKVGTVEFPNQSFTTEGDSAVTFGLNGDDITTIDGLSGTVTSNDFNDVTSVNGQSFSVEGDDGDLKVVGTADESGIEEIANVGASNAGTVKVKASGGARKITTDQVGTVEFPNQTFTTEGDSAVTYGLSGDDVTTIDSLSGTITGDFRTAITVNAEEVQVTGDSSIQVVGNDTAVSALGDVDANSTVNAWGSASKVSVTGNGRFAFVGGNGVTQTFTGGDTVDNEFVFDTDADEVTGVTELQDGTLVIDTNTDSLDSNLEHYPQQELTFATSKNVSLKFDEWKVVEVSGVTSAVGGLIDDATVIADGNSTLTVNGAAIEMQGSSSPVTIVAGESGITGVDGLESGDTVSGDLDNTAITMPGSTGTAELTVNDVKYTTYGDDDGVTLNGNNSLEGLNEGSLLKVSKDGYYIVNGDPLYVRTIDTVVGTAAGEHATIIDRDQSTLLIRKATAIDHGYDEFNIEDLTHVSHNRTVMGSEAAPWDAEYTDELLSASSTVAGASDILNSPFEVWLDNDNLKVTQSFDVSGTNNPKKIHLMGGAQEVAVGDADGNFVHVMTVASGNKNISLGNGSGDVVLVDMAADNGGTVSIVGGTGNDSIIVRDSAPVTFDMSSGGADMIVAFAEANSRISLENYDATTDAAIRIEEWESSVMAEAIESRLVDFGDGVVIVTTDEGKSKVNIDPDTDSTRDGWFVNLLSYQKEPEVKTLVGFTGPDGGTLDGSMWNKPAILIGNMFDEKSRGSTITGTASNDTIYGGAGDSLNGGGGKDIVTLVADDSRDGAVINISNGRTTIENSNNVLGGFTGDIIEIDELDITQTNIKLVDGNIVVKDKADKTFHAVITDVSTLDGGAAPYATQLFKNSLDGTVYRAAIGAESSTMYVTDDEENRPYAFIGINSEVDFTGYSGDVVADLTEDWHLSYHGGTFSFNDDGTGTITYNGGTRAYYEGVNVLRGGKGKNILKGSDDKETLIAGVGDTSLYGAGGNNSLVGYDGSNGDKEGSTTFFVLGVSDGAAHTISGFEFVADNNFIDAPLTTADNINTDIENNYFSNVAIVDDDLLIEVTKRGVDTKERALIVDAMTDDGHSKDFVVNGLVAQVGDTNVNVDKFASFYLATGTDATVNVGSSIDNKVSVWLGDDGRDMQFEGDFAVIDARNATVKSELAGNDLANTILAGTGDNSLWGGNGGNDLLVGNTGKDSFYYVLGNGNDTIQSAGDGDSVILANMTLADITIDSITSTAVTFSFSDGGKLTVNDGGNNVSFTVGEETYQLNGNREFERK